MIFTIRSKRSLGRGIDLDVKIPIQLNYAPPSLRRRTSFRIISTFLGILCVAMALFWAYSAMFATWKALTADTQVWRSRHLFDAVRLIVGVILSAFLAWVFFDRPTS